MWKEEKLADHYTISSGLSKPAKDFGSGYPFLSFSDVFWNYFAPKELGQLVQSTEKEREKCSVKKGDVFLTRTSETVEELGMSCVALKDYPDATFNGFTKRLRPKTDAVDSQFIGFYLRSPQFRAELTAYSTLTTRASLNNSILNRLSIKLPPLPTQKKIARLLSRYDDLIENNLRRIGLLEELARETYREWFVRGRFPGWESAKVDEETGLAVGWSRQPIGDVLRTKNGKSTKKITSSGLNKIFGSNGVIGETTDSNAKDAVILGRVGAYCGSTMYSYLPFWGTDNTIIVSSANKSVPINYVYQTLKMYNLRNFAGGSAQPLLTQSQLKKLKIVVPSQEVAQLYQRNSVRLFQAAEQLRSQNTHLHEARDLLLPRLMAGVVEVDKMGEV